MPFHENLINSSPDIPPDFDPCAYPILARHFFGVEIETITHTIEAECIGLDKEAA